MASAQWLLNDTSVSASAFFTAESGSSYKLKNNAVTISRTTSSPTPYEGSGCYRYTDNNTYRIIQTSANGDVTGTKYIDFYVYLPSNLDTVDYHVMTCANDSRIEYSWAAFFEDGALGFGSYDNVNGLIVTRVTSAGELTVGAWNRVAAKSDTYGPRELKAYRGSNINGSTPDKTITQGSVSSLGFGTYAYFGTHNGPNVTVAPFADDIKFDDTAYPTRSTAYTASASSTATATGTAAMSNARVGAGSGSETATGTAAASNQRTLAGTATATASATASMSSTQVIGGSGTGTASGTAAASVTALVTIVGSATATATGSAAASSTQVFAGSATVTVTGSADSSIRPLVTVDGAATVTATGASTASKQQTLAGSATATATATGTMIFITQITGTATVTATATATALPTSPGTLYGTAEKVAGLYGSSTKPTLTTRS